MKMRKILHPTDYSNSSLPALKEAIGLAKEYRAELILLHVGNAVGLQGPGSGRNQSENQVTIDRGRHLDEIRVVISAVANLQVKHVLSDQDPVAAIFRVQEECRCDLIVLWANSENAWNQWFTPTLAEEVVRQAHCPVLVIKEGRDAGPVCQFDGVATHATLSLGQAAEQLGG